MSQSRVTDDFFSPVRFDTSTVGSSVNSEESISDISNSEMWPSFAAALPNKQILEDYITETGKKDSEIELNSNDQNVTAEKAKSINVCTPLSSKSSSNFLNEKKLSSNLEKLNKAIYLKDKNTLKKENLTESSDYLQKKQKSKQRESSLDCNALKSDSKQKNLRRTSTRPASLPLKSEPIKPNVIKDVNLGETITSQPSKNICNIKDIHTSSAKHPAGKKVVVNSIDFEKNILKFNDAPVKLDNSKEKNILLHSVSEKSDDLIQDVGNAVSASSSPLSKYEASIEKIVRDCVSVECDKIRQNIYLQQMSIFREINKTKQEMEQQLLASTKLLFNAIEQCRQINSILKST